MTRPLPFLAKKVKPQLYNCFWNYLSRCSISLGDSDRTIILIMIMSIIQKTRRREERLLCSVRQVGTLQCFAKQRCMYLL